MRDSERAVTKERRAVPRRLRRQAAKRPGSLSATSGSQSFWAVPGQAVSELSAGLACPLPSHEPADGLCSQKRSRAGTVSRGEIASLSDQPIGTSTKARPRMDELRTTDSESGDVFTNPSEPMASTPALHP